MHKNIWLKFGTILASTITFHHREWSCRYSHFSGFAQNLIPPNEKSEIDHFRISPAVKADNLTES